MKINIKNCFISIAAVIIGGFSLYAPKLYFNWKDRKILTQSFTREEITYHLDSNADDIYLVKLIHAMYHSNYSNIIHIDFWNNDKSDEDLSNSLETQVNELVCYSILDESFAQQFISSRKSPSLISLQNNNYIYDLSKSDHDSTIRIKIENKTTKILYLQIEGKNKTVFSNTDRKKIMERYIQYLNLDILNDWQYNGNNYYSDNAKLRVDIDLTDDRLFIKIAPIDYTSLTEDFYLS